MSCHNYDDDINKCLNVRIKKNMKKYNCEFIIHDKKPSLCIKEGNLKKYKKYTKYKYMNFNIKDRENIKIPKIDIKEANSAVKRYINSNTISLRLNNKDIDSKILLTNNDKTSNIIKKLLSPGFHNDISINTFKHCDFIKKIFMTNLCADFIMCNTEVDDISIDIIGKKDIKKFTIILFLKGAITCLNNDKKVNKRDVKDTNIKLIWNKNKPEYITIKYKTPNKNYLYNHYKKKIEKIEKKNKKVSILDSSKI